VSKLFTNDRQHFEQAYQQRMTSKKTRRPKRGHHTMSDGQQLLAKDMVREKIMEAYHSMKDP